MIYLCNLRNDKLTGEEVRDYDMLDLSHRDTNKIRNAETKTQEIRRQRNTLVETFVMTGFVTLIILQKIAEIFLISWVWVMFPKYWDKTLQYNYVNI